MRLPEGLEVGQEELTAEAWRLLGFARGAATPGGFGWLDDDGRLVPGDLQLWITCRMTHVAALGQLLAGSLRGSGAGAGAEVGPGVTHEWHATVDHGVRALLTSFRDAEHGGWYSSVRPASDGGPGDPADPAKAAYGHAFVVLAAGSASVAGHPLAEGLLAEALVVLEKYFWDDEEGLVRESFDRDFTRSEDYRGVNANMHTVEAYLAAADVTGERRWLDRAVRILGRVTAFAREHDWRIPEHFDARWQVLPDYNVDRPAHPFRPYGVTPGHALEWARLALSAAEALRSAGSPVPPELGEAAVALAERAVSDGWAVDGAEGFVYTTGWRGEPVVRQRMHWVLAEGLGAAVALHRHTGDPVWAERFDTWWRYAREHLVDEARGSWRHELDPANRPASGTWAGKPDVYHALQAVLLPGLPLHPSFAMALRARAAAPARVAQIHPPRNVRPQR